MSAPPPPGPAPVPGPSAPSAPVPPAAAVDWRRVGLFVALALGGGWVVGLGLWLLLRAVGPALGGAAALLLGVLYMPLPLVAGLVVERVAGRRTLFGREVARLRARPLRFVGATLLAGVGAALLVVVLGIAAAVGGATLGVPGAGELVASRADLVGEVVAVLPPGTPLPADLDSLLPPTWVLLLVTLAQGLAAGVSINALFSLGEEYGWRGVLAEELAPLGTLRQHLLIGTIWGLWHAPVIVLLGHNYGSAWGWGVPAMVVVCIPLGFVLAWAAERAGVLAAAVGHGVFNALAGALVFVLVGESPLVAPPMGVLGALAAALAAALLWGLWRSRYSASP